MFDFVDLIEFYNAGIISLFLLFIVVLLPVAGNCETGILSNVINKSSGLQVVVIGLYDNVRLKE